MWDGILSITPRDPRLVESFFALPAWRRENHNYNIKHRSESQEMDIIKSIELSLWAIIRQNGRLSIISNWLSFTLHHPVPLLLYTGTFLALSHPEISAGNTTGFLALLPEFGILCLWFDSSRRIRPQNDTSTLATLSSLERIIISEGKFPGLHC